MKKFALLIHIDGWGPMTNGKTCRNCTPCQLILAHQDELEGQLAHFFDIIAPEVGSKHIVLGTIDKKTWQGGLQGQTSQLGQVLEHSADFQHVLGLKVEPRGWYQPNPD